MKELTKSQKETLEVFQERITAILERDKITLTELSRRAKIHEGTLRHYMKSRWMPSSRNASKIADAAGVSLHWLFGAGSVDEI